jgi:hypothetical protein
MRDGRAKATAALSGNAHRTNAGAKRIVIALLRGNRRATAALCDLFHLPAKAGSIPAAG